MSRGQGQNSFGSGRAGHDAGRTSLVECALRGASLAGAALRGADIRDSVLTDITVNQGTRCGAQTNAEATADDAPGTPSPEPTTS